MKKKVFSYFIFVKVENKIMMKNKNEKLFL